MSYDIAILTTDIESSDAAAWSELDALIKQQGEPLAVFRQLHDALVARYPDIGTLSDDMADDGVWSSGPLWSGFGLVAAVLSIRNSRADEVVPFVVERARALDLSVFDWTTRHLHRSEGLAGLELTVEERFPHAAPTLQQVTDAIRSLTPDGGPGFLILERAGSGYVQAAGGRGVFALEWRQVDGATFKHWAAGLANQDTGTDIRIPTNGSYVTVKSNEQLSLTDVEALITAFAKGEAGSQAFAWRDITSRFG